jgi:hypothetical protein
MLISRPVINREGRMLRGAPIMEIEEYKSLVDRCARLRLDYIIPNGSPVHARILIAKLFETARQSVSIVSGELIDATKDGQDIYGYADVVSSAAAFLRREGTKLNIVLERGIDRGDQNRFLSAVAGDPERKGEIVVFPNTQAVNSTFTPHLLITDASAYRLELDNKSVEAVANFGDIGGGEMVGQLFDKLRAYVSELKKPSLHLLPGAKLATELATAAA